MVEFDVHVRVHLPRVSTHTHTHTQNETMACECKHDIVYTYVCTTWYGSPRGKTYDSEMRVHTPSPRRRDGMIIDLEVRTPYMRIQWNFAGPHLFGLGGEPAPTHTHTQHTDQSP